jgi:hypothetical protein
MYIVEKIINFLACKLVSLAVGVLSTYRRDKLKGLQQAEMPML